MIIFTGLLIIDNFCVCYITVIILRNRHLNCLPYLFQNLNKYDLLSDTLSKPALGGVRSLTNYSVAYEETQSNRVSDFRDFACCFFQRQSYLIYFTHTSESHKITSEKEIICSQMHRS